MINVNLSLNSQVPDPSWKNLYKIGAVASLVAALVFRRNLGAAEIPLFTGISPPGNADGWFTLLYNNPLLGLTLLNFFDIANYALVGIMFLAVFIALRKTNKTCTIVALTLSLFGAVTYIVSNSALPMFSLSNQYSVATTETQKSTSIAAGQAVLVMGYNPSALYQSAGFYISLLFVALAGMLMSAVMLQSLIFGKATAYVGLIANALDLIYLIGLVLVPAASVYLLGVSCIATAGLLLMIWHLMIGIKLYQLNRVTQVKEEVFTHE